MTKPEPEVFYPTCPKAWRKWLEKNHVTKEAVWVVFYTKASEKKSLTWSDAVDEALCFGWIDSKKIKIDDERSHQFFSKRKANSTWSKINKQKVERLIANGLFAEAGHSVIEIAKKNGSWSILDEVEELIVPSDLELELAKQPDAKDFYESLSKTAKKGILQWLVLAKRPETRQNRINEVVSLAAQRKKPKHVV